MKNIKFILVMLLSLAVVISCTDNSLDPLQFSNMKKGTILALRGTQLNNLYNLGVPGATIVPKTMDGTETFVFETELLASNPADLASVDVYVIKGAGANTTRQLLKNVPASAFTKDSKYLGPYTTITLKITDVLAALGLPVFSDPSWKLDTNPLNTTYKNGINIECDINLTNGTKINAADIIASGLFQSNQFYPAMKLTWTVLKYCDYVVGSWGGPWIGTEVGSCCAGDDKTTLTQQADPHTYVMTNFFGDGASVLATLVFTPSTKLTDQIVTFPAQNTSEGGQILNSPGTYDQCKGTFSIKVSYKLGSSTYTWVYNFVKDI